MFFICDSRVSLLRYMKLKIQRGTLEDEIWVNLLSSESLQLIQKHSQGSLFEDIFSNDNNLTFITKLLIQLVCQGYTASNHCWKIPFSVLWVCVRPVSNGLFSNLNIYSVTFSPLCLFSSASRPFHIHFFVHFFPLSALFM